MFPETVETLLGQSITLDRIEIWEQLLNNWFFLAALVFLLFEMLRYIFLRKFTLNLLGDTVTNYITLAFFIGIGIAIAGAYVSIFYFVYEEFRFFTIETTPLTLAACIVAADFAYYWEHRFSHRVGAAWATHSVHHSSPHFNISVAYRFGPLDSVFPLPFHLPLALVGFNPVVIFFAEILVQLYQTALHTEVIGKLPRPIEAVLNTPSHHRVHHGSNPQYLDKNYAGIFIIWDRLFGSFAREDEPVTYGLVKPLNSINPIVVFFHGIARLARKIGSTQRLASKIGYLIRGPEWVPKRG